MDFAQHCGQGHGRSWRGILFRRTYPELGDVINKTLEWFPRFFPSAEYNKADHSWEWPDGEALLFRHMMDPKQYWSYHGHGYPWIAFEELCTWPSLDCYLIMMSCCRSDNPDVPRKYRATANPYGPGHNAVKRRWRLPGHRFVPIYPTETDEDGNPLPPRIAICGRYEENFVLRLSDPGYRGRVLASATNEAQKKAWAHADWEIVAGGMFDDCWSDANLVPPFTIPSSWRVDRAFDDGMSKPYSVGWYAESDGTDLTFMDGRRMATVRGDLFRIGELYGAKKDEEGETVPNVGLNHTSEQISELIVRKEIELGLRSPDGGGSLVKPGPADSAIYNSEPGRPSRAQDMARPVRVDGRQFPGVTWTPASKAPGSRKNGWKIVRERLAAVKPKQGTHIREAPGLFVVRGRCPEFERTMLSLSRLDRDQDEIDTNAEDHVADEVRYRMTDKVASAGQARAVLG